MIYLNNAATTFPKPASVNEAIESYLQVPPVDARRSGNLTSTTGLQNQCRSLLAALFNIEDPNNIIFTSSATHSINMILKGLPLQNSHVITTALDHNSVIRPLKTLERDNIIRLSIVECDEDGKLDYVQLEKLIHTYREKYNCPTRLIIVNHMSNVIGTVLDIQRIAEIAHQNHVLLACDASQSAGHYPVDVQAQGIDLLVFTGHKYLFALPGIGGLYISPDLELEALIVGGTGIRSDYLFQPPGRPDYYEAGTPNHPGIASLTAGTDYVVQKGIQAIQQDEAKLYQRIMEYLLTQERIILYGSSETENKPSVISFNIKGMDCQEVGFILEQSFGISVRTGLHCAPLIHQRVGSFPRGSIRVSFSCLTNQEDVDRFILALDAIIKTL